jgi:hypothetical protein
MFNSGYDPMEQLEQLTVQVNTLTANNHQLVDALNHQAKALQLLNQQVALINNNILLLDSQQKIINLAMEK